jgi:hypothetical protein
VFIAGKPATHLGEFEEADKEWDNQFGSRSNEYKICISERKKLTEFCERNTFDMLNGKYGSDIKGECTFVNQLVRSVIDYA